MITNTTSDKRKQQQKIASKKLREKKRKQGLKMFRTYQTPENIEKIKSFIKLNIDLKEEQ